MNSKTSLFSKALVKSDIKRYWWVSAIYMVLTALFILPNAVMKDIGDVYSRFDSDNGGLALFLGQHSIYPIFFQDLYSLLFLLQ